MMDEWEQFESGNSDGYDGGYEDLSSGGDSDVNNNLDWQDSLGTEGDLADQWLSQQGETEFNNPDSHLVGLDTDEAILNARLRSTGLPITSNNQIGNIPDYMRPSDVTVYNLSNLDPAQRHIDNLTVSNVMKGNISSLTASSISKRQQRQFDKITSAALRASGQDLDALPTMSGHADNLTQDDYSIGGRSLGGMVTDLKGRSRFTGGVLPDLASKYLKDNAPREILESLTQQLSIQIPRTSMGMQASFGGDTAVSHMDALPTPMQLPSRFQGYLKPTLNMSGSVYNPDYRESREYRFASKSDQASMDWFNKPSSISTLTGAPYVGMHKSPDQLSKLDPIQLSALEAQKDIEADFKGFLSLAGLAKDINGRKLSSDNSQGTATNFIRPVIGADYFSPMDELARIGMMDEEGFIGTGGAGLEGAMSPLGHYRDRVIEVFGENIQIGEDLFTMLDEGQVGEVQNKTPSAAVKEILRTEVAKKSIEARKKYGEDYYFEDTSKQDIGERVAADKAAARVFTPSSTRNTFEDVTGTRQSVEAIKAEVKPMESDSRKSDREIAQANVEAALKARGLNLSNAEQGSAEWLRDRTGVLTSTGIATSMSESVYGDTWMGHIKSSINERNNPEIAARRSSPMFDAGTRGEELGKKWFEDKFDKNIVDLGLITDPNKPNQGTSVDGVVTNRDGSIGDNLELTEFKWGTTRFPPRDAAKKHQQQLQHQMYMTGAGSVNLVTGYDPNAGTPRAGNEDDYLFSNEPVFRDPDWAKNNSDFIQARANEKASAVQSGSTENLKEGYLAALRERYPNESDKGLTKDERAEKKRLEQEDRAEEKEFKKQQTEDSKAIASGMTFLAKGAGGGINLQSSNDFLGGMGPIGKVLSGVIGAGVAGYDATRAASDYVGRAADMGASSTGAMKASEVALKSLGFNDQQALGFTERTETQQALASMGEFDPLVKRLTAYRGLVSMEQLTNMSSAQLTDHLRSQVDAGAITEQQLAGMATMAGDTGVARNFLSPEARADILGKEQASASLGDKVEGQLRATVSEMNVTAVNLNIKDKAVEKLLKVPAGLSANKDAIFNPSENLQNARDRFSAANNARMLNNLNPFASDEEDARVAKEYQESMSAVQLANKVERESNLSRGSKLESNINVTVENKQTTTRLEQSIDGKQEPTQHVVAREE